MKKIIYTTPKMKTKRFKVGDLVRVSTKTHDEHMPTSRIGHIISDYRANIHYTNRGPVKTGAWQVFMANGVTLVFHEMFLEHVETDES